MNKYFELIRPRHLLNTGLIFLLGSSFYWVINGFVNNLFGLISFLLVYASVYVYNDLIDLEEDKSHYVKWKRERPLPSGLVTPLTARFILLVCLITGLFSSFFINQLFFLINVLIVLINFSYSKFKLKRNPLVGNSLIALIQLLKLLSGWFVNGLLFNGLPLLFFFTYALVYVLLLSIYKRNHFSSGVSFRVYLWFNGLSSLFCFSLSIIFYQVVRGLLIYLFLIIVIGGLLVKLLHKRVGKNFLRILFLVPLFNSFLVISILLFLRKPF